MGERNEWQPALQDIASSLSGSCIEARSEIDDMEIDHAATPLYASRSQGGISGGGTACTAIALSIAAKCLLHNGLGWLKDSSTLDGLLRSGVDLYHRWRGVCDPTAPLYASAHDIIKHAPKLGLLLEIADEVGGLLDSGDDTLRKTLESMSSGDVGVLTMNDKSILVMREGGSYSYVDSHGCPLTAVCVSDCSVDDILSHVAKDLPPTEEYSMSIVTSVSPMNQSAHIASELLKQMDGLGQSVYEKHIAPRDYEGSRSKWIYPDQVAFGTGFREKVETELRTRDNEQKWEAGDYIGSLKLWRSGQPPKWDGSVDDWKKYGIPAKGRAYSTSVPFFQ